MHPQYTSCTVSTMPAVIKTKERRTKELHATESFSKANFPSARQKVPLTLWNPRVHFCFLNCPPFITNLNQIKQYTSINLFLKIHFNISPICAYALQLVSYPQVTRSHLQHSVVASPVSSTCHVPRPSHSS